MVPSSKVLYTMSEQYVITGSMDGHMTLLPSTWLGSNFERSGVEEKSANHHICTSYVPGCACACVT